MPSITSGCQTTKLFTEHNTWLRRWLYSRLGCNYQADDLLQDTFVRVIKRREQLRDEVIREPKAYLATIARGLITDYWRREDLEKAWKETLALLPEESVPSPEIRLSLFETLIEIDQILETLKPQVRQATYANQPVQVLSLVQRI